MSIVSRLTSAVKDEIMSSAARAHNQSAFYQDLIDMRRIDGADGLWPKNPEAGDIFRTDANFHYVYDGERWVLVDDESDIMNIEGP